MLVTAVMMGAPGSHRRADDGSSEVARHSSTTFLPYQLGLAGRYEAERSSDTARVAILLLSPALLSRRGRQIACRRRRGCARNRAVFSCAQPVWKSFRAFPEHAQQRFRLSVVSTAYTGPGRNNSA